MKRLDTLREVAKLAIDEAQQRQAMYYNKKHRDRDYRVGDRVLKRQHVLSSAAQHVAAKLATKFHGPFVVRRKLSPVILELSDLGGTWTGKVHVQDIKPYIA